MDCAICMETINKQTGVTTLSCDHSFHFRCIDEWFYKQLVEGNHQTCPCCRSEGAELDRCAFEEVEVEDEDDDESYADDESVSMVDDDSVATMQWTRIGEGRWIVVSATTVAYEGLRSLFGPLNDLEVEEETSEEVAARKIQAIFRGYKMRTDFQTHQAARALYLLFSQSNNI